MAFELYEYRIFTKFRTRKQSARFHLAVDNVSGQTPFEMARKLTLNLNVTTSFLNLFAVLISEQSGITDTTCRRISPSGGNTSRVHLPGGGLQGLWLGPMTDNFVAANIRWIRADGELGKNTNRIGPVGAGALQNQNWYFLFAAACASFVTDAIAPRVTTDGDSFHLTLMDKSGATQAPMGGFLTWPPSRQAVRRWQP